MSEPKNQLFGDSIPPEEKAFRERVQEGLPIPQNDGAGITILKRDTLSNILVGDLTPMQFMVSAIAACNELPQGTKKGTVIRAVFNAATLGLMFGDVRGEAYLVPYKDKKASAQSGIDVYDCSLIIGYKGFRNLAFQSNYLKSFTTDVVIDGEPWECWVDEHGRHFRHSTPLDREPATPKNVKAAYCQYETRTGGTGVVVVLKKELDSAQPSYSDIWKAHYRAMCEKTAIRRAAKEWAVTGKIAGATTIDEQGEAGVPQSLLCDSRLVEEDESPKVGRRKTGLSERNEELERIKSGKDKVTE